MGGDEREARHPPRPQPRAQAVEEIGERARASRILEPLPFALDRRNPLSGEAGKAHQIDAKSRIDLLLPLAGEALGKEPRHRRPLDQRPSGANANAPHAAIDPEQRQLQPPRALAAPLEQRGEIVGELRQRRHRRFAGLDWAGEAPLDAELGRGKTRRDRIARFAIERVEPGDRLSAEAGGDRRARPQREIADAPQTGARQIGANRRFEPQRSDRHVVKELGESRAGKASGGDASAKRSAPAPRPRAANRQGRARG